MTGTWVGPPDQGPDWFKKSTSKTGFARITRDLVLRTFERLVSSPSGSSIDTSDLDSLFELAARLMLERSDIPLENRLYAMADLRE